MKGAHEIVADLAYEETAAAMRSSDGRAVLLFRHGLSLAQLEAVLVAIRTAGGIIASTGLGEHAAVVTVLGLDVASLRNAARAGYVAASSAAQP